MIYIAKPYLPPLEEYTQYLARVWGSGQITNGGSLCRELEDRLKGYLGLSYLQYVSNGTIALQLAIKALELKGEVITTPFSYVATTNAIIWEGCKPVFADIDPDTLCVNPQLVEAAITEKTSGIMLTHVYGYPCDIEAIQTIADKYHLKVIYDAAHCFGVRWKGKSIAAYGDISILSFHATKLFHTAEGGAVICNSEELDKKVGLLKKFGHFGEEDYYLAGINGKNSELHAALGLCVLPKVQEMIEYRKNISMMYDELLSELPIYHPPVPEELDYNYAYYPLIFENPHQMNEVRQLLISNGIMPRRYFYPALNALPYLGEYRRCAVAESIAERVLCLPLYYSLSEADVKNICHIIRSSFN